MSVGDVGVSGHAGGVCETPLGAVGWVLGLPGDLFGVVYSTR